MEVVSIGVELDKDLLHTVPPMKLSNEEDWPTDTTLMGDYNVLQETEKEKFHGRLRSFPAINGPDIFVPPWSMHPSLFLALPLLS
jgi:hypothetical protein